MGQRRAGFPSLRFLLVTFGGFAAALGTVYTVCDDDLLMEAVGFLLAGWMYLAIGSFFLVPLGAAVLLYRYLRYRRQIKRPLTVALLFLLALGVLQVISVYVMWMSGP